MRTILGGMRNSRSRLLLPLRWAPILSLALIDPVINIAGANFPSWLLCAIAGAVLTAAIRPLFVALRIEPYLGPLLVIYLSLSIVIGCTIWLILFNRI
jgi:hypothetical protein